MLKHAFVFTACKYICLWTYKISLNIVPRAHRYPHARTLYGHIALSAFLPPPCTLASFSPSPNSKYNTKNIFVGFPSFVSTYLFHFIPVVDYLSPLHTLPPPLQTDIPQKIPLSLGAQGFAFTQIRNSDSHLSSVASGMPLGLLPLSLQWTPGSNSVPPGMCQLNCSLVKLLTAMNISLHPQYTSGLLQNICNWSWESCPSSSTMKLAEWILLRPSSCVSTHAGTEMHALAFRAVLTGSHKPSLFYCSFFLLPFCTLTSSSCAQKQNFGERWS